MSLLADLTATLFDRRYVPFRGGGRDERSLEALCDDLLTSRGEIASTSLARRILQKYAGLDDDGKRDFFRYLAGGLDLDPSQLRAALDAYEAAPEPRRYKALMAATEPRRQELARRINQLPGATGRLVDMRCDLMRFLGDDPDLARLDLDFRHLFRSWFNRGFLVLLPINWESPAHILEKIIAYEAVHAIDSWRELRRRLQPQDRRCFAFFHPAMPDEPLIFVEVALTRGIPASIQTLLSEERDEIEAAEADTATFYSISNCQEGLAGISFGNSLIKQVAEDLGRELPNLKTFTTLSPIPGLMDWLGRAGLKRHAHEPERLRALAARYLAEATDENGQPQDPVARFHLKNGAILHDIHAEADTSPNGRAQSGGVMVNYLYDLDRIGRNHEAFTGQNKVVASNTVQALARTAASLDGPGRGGRARKSA